MSEDRGVAPLRDAALPPFGLSRCASQAKPAAANAERGIYVGKSWPRPATPCDLIPRWEGEFVSHADWVNFATKRLTVASDSNGVQLKAICVDALGRRCANGRDFKRAHDEGAFPVRYFWDCWPASGIEARSDETRSGSAEGESTTGEAGDATPSTPTPGDSNG